LIVEAAQFAADVREKENLEVRGRSLIDWNLTGELKGWAR